MRLLFYQGMGSQIFLDKQLIIPLAKLKQQSMTLKSTLTSVVITCFSLCAFAQQSKIELISSTQDKTVIKVTVTGYGWKTVQTPQGEAKVITLENGTPLLKSGAPDLPKLTASVIIPDLAGMNVKSTVVSFTDFDNITVAPSKGNQYRTVNMDNVAYSYGRNSVCPDTTFPII